MSENVILEDIMRVTGFNLAENPGKGILLLDIALFKTRGTYFKTHPEDLGFSYALRNGEGSTVTIRPNDYKLNNRYPNKDYITVSQKNGKRLSKCGYVIIVDLNSSGIIEYISTRHKDILWGAYYENRYPMHLALDHDHPCASIQLHENPEKDTHDFHIFHISKAGGLAEKCYSDAKGKERLPGTEYLHQSEGAAKEDDADIYTFTPAGEPYFEVQGIAAERLWTMMA